MSQSASKIYKKYGSISKRHLRRLVHNELKNYTSSEAKGNDNVETPNHSRSILNSTMFNLVEEVSIEKETINKVSAESFIKENIEEVAQEFSTPLEFGHKNSPDENDKERLKKLLASWVVEFNISHTAANRLLLILNNPVLPKDVRTLLKISKCEIPDTIDCSPGHYCHFGVSKSVKTFLDSNTADECPTVLLMNVNIDGLPVFKSSSNQFWPIIISLVNFYNQNPILVGIYYGSTKPNSSNELIKPFVKEMLEIKATNGITYNGKQIQIQINAIICDAPAKAFILCIKNHNGYFGCNKCCTEGTYADHHMTYPDLYSRLRTDADFRQQSDEDHHRGTTILTELDIDLVQQVPLDYMHLTCLGIMKKILKFLISGAANIRLKEATQVKLNDHLRQLRQQIPAEFSRLPRSTKDIDHWKATELRMFLLYLGPLVLYDHLTTDFFKHFMCFHTGMRIISSGKLTEQYVDYAKELFTYFVEHYGTLYGKKFVNYNVHNLIHLCDDVKKFGCVDKFSSFPYENYLYNIKKCIKAGPNPLAQVCHRILEYRAYHTQTYENSTKICKSNMGDRLIINNTTIDASEHNNCFLLNNDAIVLVRNVSKMDESFFLDVQQFIDLQLDQYMVVLDLPVIDDEESYSIAHSGWLRNENDATVMLYPSRSSINKALRLKKKPEPNWMKAIVEVVATFKSLEDAKAKMKRLVDFESTTVTEEEDIIPPRKSRFVPNPRFSDCLLFDDKDKGELPECPTLNKDLPTPLPSPSFSIGCNLDVAGSTNIRNVQHNGNGRSEINCSRSNSANASDIPVVEGTLVNLSSNLEDIPVVEYVDKMVQTDDNGVHLGESQVIREVLEIKNLLVSFHLRMQNIEQYIQRGAGSINAEKVDTPKLPLDSRNELDDFNEKLTDPKVYKAMVQLLKRNMGNNARDCIYKMLNSCFSLEMARVCSLMGKHNNIKLDGMTVMELLKDATIENYANLSNDLFKAAVMDWFRGAELRYRRKNKN